MAIPPSSGMGWRWTFRGPGWSTMPTRKASCLTGTMSPREATRAVANASKLAVIPVATCGPRSSRGQHMVQCSLHLRSVPGFVVPVDGPVQTFSERELGFPTEKLFCQGIVGDPVEGPGRHVGQQFDFSFLACELEHHVHRIQNTDPLHGSEIHGRAVVNFFPGQNGSRDDIVDIGPITNLRAVAPHL